MSPLDILTLHKDQFYYALSRSSGHGTSSAYIIISPETHYFNKDRYRLDTYVKKNNLVVTEVTNDILDNYVSVDNYLKEEWGLECCDRGITVGISESLYELRPLWGEVW